MTVIPFNKDVRLPHEGQLHELNKLLNKVLLALVGLCVFAWLWVAPDSNVTSAAPKANKLQMRLSQ